VNHSLARARAEWDAEAPAFDAEPDHGLGDPTTRAAWRDLLLAHLPAAPARIADLGCGTGSLAVLLAESGYDVTGIDLSEAMLAAARSKASEAGVEVRLAAGDAANPALARGGFDAVLCRHVLWALPEPAEVLARWCDLLRPGGGLVLVEGSWHTGAGLAARRTEELVREHRAEVSVLHLTDPVYWGGPTSDERYLVVSPR
jgi:2-polyprenyl-3-methyl-5-hydroxy-6-metoxy-1,4-benzoquinol methylase